MSAMPEGWAKTTLGEIASWSSGGTPSRSEPSYYGGDIPWIKSGELNARYVTRTEENITEAGLAGSSAKLFPSGSVAIAMYGATIGKTAILGVDAATNQACAVGIPEIGVSSSTFLYRLLQNEKDAFIAKGKGGAQPNISQAVIKNHEIYLPPLAEQTRIAAKLDELLAQVDTLKARIDGIPALLKRFRQSVLAAAVSGRLTEEWRGGDNPDRSFKKLGDAEVEVKTGPFGSALHKSDYIIGGIPVINPMHISEGKIMPSQSMTISQQKYLNLEAWHLRKGDVVVGRRGEMGRASVVASEAPQLCGTGSMILRVGNNAIPKYLEIILRSPTAVSYFNSASVGSTMVNLNQQVIKNLEVYFPSLREQTEIVRRVEQLFTFADQLEARIAAAQERIDKLTQSILAKAFRGELVPQDPNDEPASVLLERIKAQRAAAPKAKRGRKAKA